MKTMKMIIVLPMLFFLLIGCSTISHLKIIDSTGRELPTPNYTLKNLYNGMSAVFYYASISTKKDVDGTLIPCPTYLSMNQVHTISAISCISLIIEVSNPQRFKYKIWAYSTIKKLTIDGDEIKGSKLAESNLEYRQFVFNLPVNSEIKEVSYGVSICDEKTGKPLMYFGDFHYKIK